MMWSAQFECSECKAKHNVACSQPYFKVLEFQCLRCHSITATDRNVAPETSARSSQVAARNCAHGIRIDEPCHQCHAAALNDWQAEHDPVFEGLLTTYGSRVAEWSAGNSTREIAKAARDAIRAHVYRRIGRAPETECSESRCNHDLEDRTKTLKATGAPHFGWRCTVCGGEWFPEKASGESSGKIVKEPQ